MIVPAYLHPGDTIGLVCPSGFMPEDKFSTCVTELQQWGFRVKQGATPGNQFHYFSGTDEERRDDLQRMLDDTEVKAILCARGGYGLSRIIDQLDFSRFIKHPKWIIGFSDVTVLQAHLLTRYKTASIHGPMAAAFNDGESGNIYVQSLKEVLLGKPYRYAVQPHPLNREGQCAGRLVGGNLALVAHLAGTGSSFKTKNKILLLEDIGEYLYNIDRMMIQLKRAGMLDRLAGLIFGRFSDLKDTTVPFGQDIYSILEYHVKEFDCPVCYDFPIGHEKENYAVKIGVKHKLKVTGSGVELKEVT